MKYIYLLLLIFQSALISSCSKSDDNTQITTSKSDLIGAWNLTDVSVNNKGLNDKEVANAHYLVFQNEEDYYRTYVTGTWKINNNIIELDTALGIDDFDWDMEVIEITPFILKVIMKLSETEYGWDFEEYSSDEVLEIIETYERQSD